MGSSLKYYVSLYYSFLKINIKSLLTYDIDFILGLIGMLIQNICNFCIILFMFNFIDNITGYSFEQILFLYAFSSMSFAVWYFLFSNTISITYFIKTGLLDRFMLRPLNILFQIVTDSFEADSIGDLFFSFIILIISIVKLKVVSIKLILLPILIISSSLIYASIALLGSIMSFFTIGNTNLSNISMSFHEFSKYPLNIYSKLLKFILTVIIPIGFAAYYPSIYFMSYYKSGFIWVIISPIFSCLIFWISCKIWTKCLKYYNGAGN